MLKQTSQNVRSSQKLRDLNDRQGASLFSRYRGASSISNEKLLKLLEIPSECKDLVRVMDEVGNLKLVHYLDVEDPRVHHVRGVIFDEGSTGLASGYGLGPGEPRVVCRSFPFTPEIIWSEETEEEIASIVNAHPPGSVLVQDAPEGTLLRVFNFYDKWYVSTHKKIDGTKSRWDSPPFGVMFNECLGIDDLSELDKILDKRFCYVFLMCHPSHVLVCRNPDKILYCVATYSQGPDGVLKEIERCSSEDVGCESNILLFDYTKEGWTCVSTIEHPSIYLPATRWIDGQEFTFEEFKASLSEQDPNSLSGALIKTPDGKIVKITTPQYAYLRDLRGNEPNALIRYVELRALSEKSKSEEDRENLERFIELFPHRKGEFASLERNLHRVVGLLYRDFEWRYVNGNYLRVPQNVFFFLEEVLREDPSVSGKFLEKEEKIAIKARISKRFLEMQPHQAFKLVESLTE